MIDNAQEVAAKALWWHRATTAGAEMNWQDMTWEDFCINHRDIAAIYRQNALVMLLAIGAEA